MNVKQTQSKIAKSEQLSKFVISLIREHYDPTGKDSFLEISRKVADYFGQIKEYELASYVRILIGEDKNVFVPM